MADLFQGMTVEPDIFSGLIPDENVPGPTANPNLTARMAALGDTEVSATIGAQVEALTEQYRQQIEVSGDNLLRNKAAARQNQLKVKALTDLAANPASEDELQLVEGARHAALRVMSDDLEKAKEDALERQAIEKIQDLAATDPTQAKVLLNTMELGNADERITDINTKRLILQREIEKAGIEKENQPWFFDLMDVVMSVIPFNISAGKVGNVDLPDVVKSWGDNILPGRRRNAERSSLWNMPAADMAIYVREHLLENVKGNSTLFGYHDRSEELNILSGLTSTPESLEDNLWAGVDNFGGLPLTRIGKAGISVPSLMVKNGARKQAAEMVARAAQVAAEEGGEKALAKTGISAQEVADASLPSVVNPTPSVVIPLAGDTVTIMDRAAELMAKLPEALPSDRFANQAEIDLAVSKVLKDVENAYGRQLTDFEVKDIPLATGSKVRDLSLTLGKKEGGGFATEKNAQKYLDSLEDTGEIVRDESGAYFVKITKPMPETGFYAQTVNPGQGTFIGLKAGDPILDNLLNARLVGDKLLADQAQRGTNNLNKVLKSVITPLTERINKLDAKAKIRVGAILSLGRKEAKWFDRDTRDMLFERSFGRPMNEAEHDVYNAMRDAHDLEYLMRNDDLFMQKHVKGAETVTFNTGLGDVNLENGFIDRTISKAPESRSFNVSTGVHYTKKLDEATLDQLRSEGFIRVTTERAIKLSDDTHVSEFFMKSGDLKAQPLRRDQLAYRAGGHTYYGDKYFGKQAVKRTQPDTLSEFLDSPNTYINGTKAEVEFWTSRMERARLAYKDMIKKTGVADIEALDALLEDVVMTGKEFADNMANKVFEADTSFVTKFDRELPDEYLGNAEFAEDGMNGWLRTNGRMYYSGKGDDLVDYLGREATIVDPYQAVNKSLHNVANLSSFADYKLSATERWVNTYARGSKSYFDFKPGASNMSVFSDAVPIKGVDQRIINKAEKQRELIRRTIGWQTDQDRKSAARIRSITEWINGDNPSGLRNKLARDVTNWYDNHDPVSTLRGYAFDAKLGLLNPAQLPLQASTMAAIFQLSPKHGLAGMANLHFLRQYLTKSGTEHYLDTLIQRNVHKFSGFKDPKEFKVFMKSAKKSGFLDIGGTHGLINSGGPDAAISNIGNKVDTLREQARFLFNEGEIWNRSVAMHVAWKETREKFPTLRLDDPDFIRRWEGRSEEYAFNMSRESQAYWQRGLLSIPTQFWAYQARMLEAMLGNAFTPAQRFRLAVGQTILYGSAGLPFAGFVSDKLKEAQGGAPDIDSFWGTIDRGVVDRMFYGATGADMSFKRYASGNWITDTIETLLGASPYGEKSFAELATGATGSTVFKFMGDGWNIMDKMIKYSVAEGGGDIGEAISGDDWIRLASNITTISSAHKAWLVGRRGTLETSKGQTIFTDLPSNAAWEMMLLGAEPGAQADLSAKLAYLKNKKEQIKNTSRIFESYRIKALNDPKRADEFAKEANIVARLTPEEIRIPALQSMHKNIEPSLYEGVTKQIEKEMAKEQMIKDMQ